MEKQRIRFIGLLLFAAVFVSLFSPSALAAGPNPVSLPVACYTITTRLDSHQYLDVSGGGIENGTNIHIWEQNGTQAQMFYTVSVGEGWFGLLNINSRKAVDVAGGEARSGVNVQLYDWNGSDAQLWCFEVAPGGGYFIRNKLGFYLDVSGGGTQNGTNVQVYEWNGTDSQIWDITPASGLYTLTPSLNSGMRLDVAGNGSDNQTNIQIFSSNGTKAQVFCLVQRDEEWFSIHHSDSRKVLDVAGGVSAEGVNVQLYDWNGTDAQLWHFVSAGNGNFYIQNKLGYYLDVSSGKDADGTNVQVCSLNGSSAQQWRIEPADLTYEITAKVLVSLHFDNTSEMEAMEKLLYYFANFNHGAKYDIKRKDCWNNFFGDIAFPGTNGVVMCRELITPEQLGNIIYGFTGKSMGLNDTLIYQGGGYAAQGFTYINDESMYYGDSAMDHKFISIGIGLSSKPATIDLTVPDLPYDVFYDFYDVLSGLRPIVQQPETF